MKRSAVFLASVVAVAVLTLTGAQSGATSSTTTLSLSDWVGSFCVAIAPSVQTLQDAANQAEASGSTDDIVALLDATSALLAAVSSEMTTLGAPPIDNGDVMVAEYPGGIAQAIAAVSAAAAAVQSGSITSIDQIGSIDTEGGVSEQARAAWDRIEAEMRVTPACEEMQGILGAGDTSSEPAPVTPKMTG